MSSHCVYRIDCAATGKAYIGLTKAGAAKRFAAHKYNALTGRGGALYAAIRKHGVEAFSVCALEEGLTLEQACEREIALIAELGTRTPHGYNLAIGGDSGLVGYVASPETKARMSETHKRRQADPALRAKTSAALTGRKKSPEHVAKVSAALTGKTISEETKAKLRAANLGKKQSAETVAKRAEKMRGQKRSKAVCDAIGDRFRGKPKTDEQRRKISEALKGRTMSDERRRRLSEATRGKPKSEEWKAKMRATMARKREERELARSS